MSSAFNSYNEFLTGYTMISGVCIREGATDAPSISFNPKLSRVPEYTQEILTNPDSVKAKIFTDFDFLDYAEKLKNAGAIIQKAEPDIVLVPMRGGVRPWQHLRIYCNIGVEKSVLFPFTGEEKNSEETRAVIGNALHPFLGRERLNIVCIDAAEGGQGSKQLVRVLEVLHTFDRKSYWHVTLCLFVPKERENADWKHAREHSDEPNFRVEAILLGVAKVIREDMNTAMISPENFGNVRRFKTQIGGVDYLVESAELPGVIDQKIVEATHYSLLGEPFSTVIDIRQWKKDGPYITNGQ
jgi:hypothetical protein